MLTKHQYVRRATTASSVLALATALVAFPAAAQSLASFNAGTPTVTSGNVTVNTSGNTDTFIVSSPTAVLDFTPNDTAAGPGVINFQTAGTTAVFQSSGNFTVLNRIVPADPTRSIVFNGNVRSQIGAATGGNVWFYSPGGVILGANAVFDVGSLLLSTADPTGGTGTIGSTNVFNLSSKADSGAAVTIQPGAQITALNEGSYVALVAPVVNQNGVVQVNGNAAYVAAEQATLTFSGGLFDIQVAVGSDGGGTPLTHNGSTKGPSSTGAADKHGIYMVAVPKNSAITMAIAPTGQLGFDVAASATIENGAIYLQAGGDVSIDPTKTIVNRIKGLPNSAQPASIELRDGTITSTIAAQATTDVSVIADTATGLSLAQDAYFYARQNATIVATAESTFTASKSVILNSFGNGFGSKAQIDALGESTMTFADVRVHADALSGRSFTSATDPSDAGKAAIRSTGGAIAISGDATVSAVGSAPTPGDAFGGSADIKVNKGAGVAGLIDIAGSAFVNASADGQGAGAIATAGFANVTVLGASSFKAANLISVSANASGTDGAAANGGIASISIGADGGSIESLTANINADGLGANVVSGTGGTATGGNALITTAPTPSAPGSLKFDTVTVSAIATGGTGTSSATVAGGNATAGQASILINKDSTYATTGATILDAVARGGAGKAGGAGGSATQGNIQLSAFDGAAISFGSAKLDADTFGGAGGDAPSPTTTGGTGGAAIKGPGASMFAGGGGTITGGKTQVLAIARAGAGGNGFEGTGFAGAGGDAAAGSAVISTDTGGNITLGDTFIFAGVAAGSTGLGQANGPLAGGNAFGGISTLNAKAGTVDLVSLVMATDVGGGTGRATGSNGGNGTGGALFVGANNGGTLKVGTSRFEMNSSATGGNATTGPSGTVSAGNGIAGSAEMTIEAGSSLQTTAALVDFRAFGTGGNVQGTSGQGNGGLGQGGRATLTLPGVSSIVGGVRLNAIGTGGNAAGAGTGGIGRGGAAQISSFGANASTSLTVSGSINMDASAFGGFSPAGIGGNAFAGITPDPSAGPFNGAGLFVDGGSFTIAGDIDANVEAFGGDGAVGGTGTGGSVRMFVSPNASLTAKSLSADVNVFGGDASAGAGGAAIGGSIDVGVSGALTFSGSVNLNSGAFGGAVSSSATGAAGSAAGGKTFFTANGGDITIGSLFGDATARGGTNSGTGDGGAATGGRMRVSTFAFGTTPGSGGSTVAIRGSVNLLADGIGGDATAGVGGAGTGGVFVDNTKSNGVEVHVLGGAIDFAGVVSTSALGSGGNGTVQAGAGTGGRVSLISFGGDLDFQQVLFSDARGLGGFSSSALGGEGKGGTVFLQSIENATVNVPAATVATVSASSGNLLAAGIGGSGATGGGAGRGGSAGIFVSGVQNSLTSSGGFTLRADASGGAHNGTGAGTGGLGQGGSTGATISGGTGALAALNMDSTGFGGSGATGGAGQGGSVNIVASTGGRLTLGEDGIFADAGGFGGSISGSPDAAAASVGGTGTGGILNLVAQTGGSITSGVGDIQLDAFGSGGSVSSGFGTGGLGKGGNARVLANDGTLSLGGNVDILAFASGGDADAGNAGAAVGGEARLSTIGGSAASDIQILGSVLIDAGGSGGFSNLGLGGDGTGGRPADATKGPFNAGAYISATGGRISIAGDVELDASGSGGSGGAGGALGFGGLINIAAFGAEIEAAGIIDFEADGSGGEGLLNGANGGAGQGGNALVLASSGGDSAGGGVVPLGSPSRIALGQLFIDVSAEGGTGAEGTLEGTGGTGGDGFGGFASVGSQAGSGQLVTDTLFVFAQGQGGDGGLGGIKSGGATGGAGGAGGKGFAGGANVGTFSGPDTTVNSGSAKFRDVSIFSVGIGGRGGDGTDGGVGGAGGAGQGNNSFFLSRGAPVIAGTISIDSSGFGGSGGLGSAEGKGGSAIGGLASLASTNRFNNATQAFNRPERGSLTAISFNGTALSLAGPGSTATAGRVELELSKGDATIGQVALTSFTLGGAEVPPAINSFVKVDAGTLDLAADFNVSVAGPLTFSVVNGGVIRAGSLSLSATGGLTPPSDPAAPAGLIDITGDYSASFGGDFITNTNYRLGGSLSLSATGNLQIGNAEVGGDVTLSTFNFDPVTGTGSGGNIVAGNVTAGGNIFLDSLGSVSAGDLRAGNSIEVFAAGPMQLGDLTAGLGEGGFSDPEFGSVNLDAESGYGGVAITTGNIIAVSFSADTQEDASGVGSITTGSIRAESISIESAGTLTTGDLSVGDFFATDTSGFEDSYELGIVALGDLKVGTVNAFKSAAIGSIDGSVTTGAITAGGSVFILAKNNVTVDGAITAGSGPDDNVFISNSSILESDPVFDDVEELDDLDFTETAVLNTLVPVRVNGAITLNGLVTVSRFAAAASGGFSAAAITAPNRLFIDAPPPCFIGTTPCSGGQVPPPPPLPPPPPPPPPPEEDPLQQVVAPVPVNVLAIVEDVLSSTSDPETVAALPTINLVTTIDTGQLRTEPVITDPVTGGGNTSLWEGAAQSEEDERRPTGPGDEE